MRTEVIDQAFDGGWIKRTDVNGFDRDPETNTNNGCAVTLAMQFAAQMNKEEKMAASQLATT